MQGDVGPYIAIDGPDVWVPRTVPYLQARRIAKTAAEWGDRLVYEGKIEDAELVGFVRDCRCEERCERRWTDEYEETGDTECLVPAWKFTLVER